VHDLQNLVANLLPVAAVAAAAHGAQRGAEQVARAGVGRPGRRQRQTQALLRAGELAWLDCGGERCVG